MSGCGIDTLDQRRIQTEGAEQLQQGNQRGCHGHESEIGRHQHAGEDYGTDQSKAALQCFEQQHPNSSTRHAPANLSHRK